MKILFISSGNSVVGLSSIIKNQGESLIRQGLNLTYFTIKGKGIKGYLRNIRPLRALIKQNNFDLIHAHYSMSAFVASLAGARPLVVSLMGSDVKSEKYYKFIIKLFHRLFWSAIVVKSKDMKSALKIKDAIIIPNGVDFKKFKPLDRNKCKSELAWDASKQQILFAASPSRYEKNFALAEAAFSTLKNKNIELKFLQDVPNKLMPVYHNAADMVLLTSLWEGSPNVIKEAMACNVPVVSTDVGDVREVIGDTEGCYITSFDPQDVAGKIKKALIFSVNKGQTQGRERLMELGLDTESVASKLMDVYRKILNK